MMEFQGGRGRERSVAFVVARLDSSRLPNKHFRLIGDQPLLAWIISRLRQCQELDQIVIATAAEPVNQALFDFARHEAIDCFCYEGKVDEVTTRLRKAAEQYRADICVLISGDCPLISPEAVDLLIRELRRHQEAEVVRIPPDHRGQPAAVEGISAARRRAWQRADDLSDRPELKEHQFPIFHIKPECFHILSYALPPIFYAPAHRLSVDTWADLEFMNRVWEELTARGKPFELPEVLGLLKERPELRLINAHVHQRRLIETVRQILFLVDAGDRFGYERLNRCRELGLQVVERLGWPVTFLVDDQQALQLLTAQGLPVVWGAWQRTARLAPGNPSAAMINDLASRYHLLVVDIHPREIPAGWRQRLAPQTAVVVLDNLQAWSREADLVFFSGVISPTALHQRKHDPVKPAISESVSSSQILSGLDFVILRREVRRFMGGSQKKEVDILAQLDDPGQRETLQAWAHRNNLEVHIRSGGESDFDTLLARARFFLGSSHDHFYEALALQTYPIAWSRPPSHGNGARLFYQRVAIRPAIIVQAEDLTSLLPLLRQEGLAWPSITDGTPRIVQALAHLFAPDQEVAVS
jgi:spore coat polysaccharide biosynthesis protein SpsF (cytidylyltransferase family)